MCQRLLCAPVDDIFTVTTTATHSAPYRVTKLIVYDPIFHNGEGGVPPDSLKANPFQNQDFQ